MNSKIKQASDNSNLLICKQGMTWQDFERLSQLPCTNRQRLEYSPKLREDNDMHIKDVNSSVI